MATVRGEAADRLPMCSEGLCHGYVTFLRQEHPDLRDRALHSLSLGLDDGVRLSPPLHDEHGYESRQWTDQPAGAPHPVMHKEYVTPAGVLRQVVNRTPDYPGQSIPLLSDHNVPAGRSLAYLVSGAGDLDALEYVLRPPGGEALDAYYRQAAAMKTFCLEHGLLLSAYSHGVGDPLLWLSGVERIVMMAFDEPDVLRRYVDIVSGWNRRRLEIMIDAGVDVVVRRGWYESTDFWSPAMFRQFLYEPLKGDIETAHRAGVLLSYVMNSGSGPLLGQIRELGPDIFSNVDPEKADLAAMKRQIGTSIALCGGVNNYHVLERGSADDVRRAVREAIECLAPGGRFILAPGDSLLDVGPTTRRNFQVMIETWKEMRSASW
jgi:hypothetical protein